MARRLPIVLVSMALAGCGNAAPGGPPLVLTGGVTAGGRPALGSGPGGVTLRFVERGRFGIGIELRNRSRRPVTVVDVRTVEPPRTAVRQVGTRLVPWSPPRCSGRSCPGSTFFRGSYGAVRPLPVTAAPGKEVGAQLNFRLGSCRKAALASPAPLRLVVAEYRFGRGPVRHETLPLASASLRLRVPRPSDCVRRPHSSLAVSGRYVTSSDWVVPGSAGDSCRRTATGELRFRSRLYLYPGSPAVRVLIRLPRFRGRGTYYLGQVRVVAGRTTFRAERSLVSVTHATSTALGGRFRASLTDTLGAPFRAYGAWRCTIT